MIAVFGWYILYFKLSCKNLTAQVIVLDNERTITFVLICIFSDLIFVLDYNRIFVEVTDFAILAYRYANSQT